MMMQYFVIQDGGRLQLDFHNCKFLSPDCVGQMRITVPNFNKIGQTHLKMIHIIFFKMAAVRHLGFLKFEFSNSR